jgi:SAM-dependent methyltransferase
MNPYRLLYRLGITPWDRDTVPEPVVELTGTYASPGRALDLGCGTGRDAVYLAGLGWTVTAVDGVPQALDAARARARDAHVDVRWVLGDVTRLSTPEVGDGYNLLMDRGCFHGLSADERARCASGVTAVAAPGARLLMLAFHPRRWGLGPSGVTGEEVRGFFEPAWAVVSEAPEPDPRLPRWIGDAKPTWYQLVRSG